MADRHNSHTAQSGPMRYQIRLQGYLGTQWTEWFDGLTITHTTNGDTLLTGLIADQAALYGVLRKVRDLGLPLLAVLCIETAPSTTEASNQIFEENP